MQDEIFTLSTRLPRSAAEVFAWHERPGALQCLCPPWERVEVVHQEGGIRAGARAIMRTRIGPVASTWLVEHRDYVFGKSFRDVMLSGPFAKWEHRHEISSEGPTDCVLTDAIHYRLPLGAAGKLVGGAFVRRKLARIFAWRHAVTRADLETAARYPEMRPKRIVVAGASGLIGRALVPFLQTQGHQVVRLVRHRAAASEAELFWNPAAGEIDAAKLEGVDAVINLAGENVAGGRWTNGRRHRIMRSRVDATRTLIGALAKLSSCPAVFISAAAIGFYGDHGDELVTERDGIGQGFLPEVCLAWETHAQNAAKLGMRTALLRFGIVLSPAGGALAKLLPVFRVGLGGRMGTGRQWMSWTSIDDAVGAIYHALREERAKGPINVVGPQAVTNAEFAGTLGRVLRRPAGVPVPAMALRAIFGQMAEETLLTSIRAVPEKLRETGYRFHHADLATALRHVLGR